MLCVQGAKTIQNDLGPCSSVGGVVCHVNPEELAVARYFPTALFPSQTGSLVDHVEAS